MDKLSENGRLKRGFNSPRTILLYWFLLGGHASFIFNLLYLMLTLYQHIIVSCNSLSYIFNMVFL